MRFLFLEPFFGGSHRQFAEGLTAHSRHAIDLLTLPARFWKWRMRSAALTFIRKCGDLGQYDGLMCSSMMSLADFKALAGQPVPPVLVYFHETQLTYPLAPGERPDYQFGVTDLTTALAADQVRFNSHDHLRRFFEELTDFIRRMPDTRPKWAGNAIRSKAGVLYPGCDIDASAAHPLEPWPQPPLVVWNHRWEHDKNPEAFFDALEQVAARGVDFRVAVLGQRYRQAPEVFKTARRRLGRRIVQYGFVDDRQEYGRWLRRGTVVVSTALQENFGLAVVEAVGSGCLPLLPQRLSYPELLPADLHELFLYPDQDGLVARLAEILHRPQQFEAQRKRLADAMAAFGWERVIGDWDAVLEDLGCGGATP